MDALTVEDLWKRDAYSESGRCLGRIEAVGTGRDLVPRRIGVRSEEGSRRLRFFSLIAARLDGRWLMVSTEPSLVVLPGERP